MCLTPPDFYIDPEIPAGSGHRSIKMLPVTGDRRPQEADRRRQTDETSGQRPPPQIVGTDTKPPMTVTADGALISKGRKCINLTVR